MAWTESITHRFVGAAAAAGSATHRQRRWHMLAETFPIADMTVLDMGGTAESWRLCPAQPARLVLLNTFPQESTAEVVIGDACAPPPELRSEHFDLVFSNSVIEHVGGHWRRERFADVVRDLGEHHWIQTPNRYFPVEPHWLCPGLQYLPLKARAYVGAKWPLGNMAAWHVSLARSLELAQAIELLEAAQMRYYFPSSRILRERFAGLTKSLIAVR